jgi:hypothetical protein
MDRGQGIFCGVKDSTADDEAELGNAIQHPFFSTTKTLRRETPRRVLIFGGERLFDLLEVDDDEILLV